nr:radical SAM protein [Methanocalculus chunghsingensis]
MVILFVSLFRYRNFTIRLLHPLIREIPGVVPYSVFLKDVSINRFEYPTEDEERLFLDLIDKLQPDIVSFTVLSPFADVARRLSRLVKEKHPDTVVIWGGIHPTLYPEDCISDVDILCIGEGEGALTDLLTAMRDGLPYDQIANLWVREGEMIYKNPLRPLIEDLDSLPVPLYGDDSFFFIDTNSITQVDTVFSEPEHLVQTARGCPWRCSFCVNSLLRNIFTDLGPYVRRRTVDSVIAELSEYLGRSKGMTRSIFFIDEVFAIDKKWVDEFATKYQKLTDLPFSVYYHPKQLNLAIIDRLVEAGLAEVDVGIQSGSDSVRNRIYNRPGTSAEIVALAKEVTRRNVKVRYDLIMESPYDTEDKLKETIDLLLQLPKPLTFNLYSLQYFPDYPLTDRAIEDGFIRPEDGTRDVLLEEIQHDFLDEKAFIYSPRFFPFNRLRMMKNIIWLVVWNHANDRIVRQAVLSDSPASGLLLQYLNIKSVLYGRLDGVGVHPLIRNAFHALGYLRRAEFRGLFSKVNEHLHKDLLSDS